jgi:hypothetical protein
LKEQDDEPEDDFEDEMKREDGLLRYWTFINGEQFRLFAALAAGFFVIVWCFLYILGGGQTIVGNILLILTGISFVAWRVLDRQVRRYQEEGWKRDKRSLRTEKIEIRVAIGLWLFIFVSVDLILLLQWRHGH